MREWLLQLTEEDRRTIGRDIQRLEFEWPVGMPHCRPLAKGLWEVRSAISGGRVARVMFGVSGVACSCCMVSSRRPRGLRAATSTSP